MHMKWATAGRTTHKHGNDVTPYLCRRTGEENYADLPGKLWIPAFAHLVHATGRCKLAESKLASHLIPSPLLLGREGVW
jgi:hypothetical protein